MPQEPGKLVCRTCGAEWHTDEATTVLLELLVSHAGTHDIKDPLIHLRQDGSGDLG
jgi:hypothetical protein